MLLVAAVAAPAGAQDADVTTGATDSAAPASRPADAPATTPATVPGQAPAKESLSSRLHDPQDGKLDLSRYLLEHRGALIVPIIITEPAVGNGGGIAPVFFHQPVQSDASKARGEHLPPDMYGAMAFKTANGSHAYGAGGTFHFKDDTWRYMGGVGKGSFNLDYYPQSPRLAPFKIGYNMDGLYSLQQVSRRLGRSKMYLSLRWVYLDVKSSIKPESDKQYFKPRQFDHTSSGLGTRLEYDSRDNTLSPADGVLAKVTGTFYSPTFGSDGTRTTRRSHWLIFP